MQAARRLRECNPVAEDAYAGAAGERLGQITFNHIITSPAQSSATPVAESARVPNRRRIGLLAGGLGLAAAGMATVVAVASAGPAGSSGPAPAGRAAARQYLLAAAAAAAATPGRPGNYWYVRTTVVSLTGKFTVQTWTQPDGRSWTIEPTPYGVLPDDWGKGSRQFSLAGLDWMFTHGPRAFPVFPPTGWKRERSLGVVYTVPVGPVQFFGSNNRQQAALADGAGYVSYSQLQQLPASPIDLTDWLLRYQRNFTRQTGLSEPEPATLIQSLAELVAAEPAPQRVRAAAFRAMATLSNATSVGSDDGGQTLRISLGGKQQATLTIDPATPQAHQSLTVSTGARLVSSVSVTAHWVNRRP
jgi:hypothetical protein